MSSLLNNGSMWALNLELVIARIAFFCNLWILELLNPQDKTPKCKCGDIRLLYIVFKTSLGRKCFSLWRKPTVLPIFYAIFPTWDDNVMVSLIVKARKLNSLIRSILLFSVIISKEISSILQPEVWKTIYCVLSKLRESLFAVNHI